MIDNGTAACQLKGQREICTIYCDDGFQLLGNATALCGDLNNDGRMEWITPAATCKSSIITRKSIYVYQHYVLKVLPEIPLLDQVPSHSY